MLPSSVRSLFRLGLGSLALIGAGLIATGCGDDSSDDGLGDISCDALARPTNDAFCHGSCEITQSCSLARTRPIDACCVLLKEPSRSVDEPFLARTDDTKEYAGDGPPDLSCFEPANYPQGGESELVTMEGVVKIFSKGCSSDGVTIEVWTVKRTGGDDDGMPDQLVGSPVATVEEGEFELEDNDGCPDGRKAYKFTYEGVPTHTEFLVKTFATVEDGGWATFYDYNQYISPDDPDFDASTNTYNRNVRAVASDDYQTIPQAAIGKTITKGNGALAGEIHDCGNVRLQNAVVDVTATRNSMVFFTPDEDAPLPDPSRTQIGSTGRLGLYAALDVAPGPVRMSAIGLRDNGTPQGELVSLGYFNARVFPDAISSVTLRGLRPFQIAQAPAGESE